MKPQKGDNDMKVDISQSCVSAECLAIKEKEAEKALNQLESGSLEMTGWVKRPLLQNQEELSRILHVAGEVRRQCKVFVVLGIGGSSLGAKAVLQALQLKKGNGPEVLFAGDSLDSVAISQVADRIRREESCLCVISKSGTTVETLVSFSILKEVMKEKYGGSASSRIYTVTDEQQGMLREETQKEGYISFSIPRDIGGRYSVLTPVGLFPLAVGGVDIRGLLEGAASMARDFEGNSQAIKYAATRNCLGEMGKKVEAMESFDPAMDTFGQWLKQLFGESEGKEGKGIYPTVLTFTRDLHSVGQFLQEGTPIIFETMILFEKSDETIIIPASAGAPLAGLTVEQVNNCVTKGVIAAHTKGDIPLMTLTLPQKDAFSVGQLIYFFELSCGISAMMLGVNPFNQPGVERYKQEAWEEILKLETKEATGEMASLE